MSNTYDKTGENKAAAIAASIARKQWREAQERVRPSTQSFNWVKLREQKPEDGSTILLFTEQDDDLQVVCVLHNKASFDQAKELLPSRDHNQKQEWRADLLMGFNPREFEIQPYASFDDESIWIYSPVNPLTLSM